MATQVQLRRGTATENNSFTGAQGELSYDTTNKRVRVHDGSTAGGFELKTENSSGDTLFADNEKAIFGAGSDLQIYHDGSASYIDDAGTGALYIRGNAIVLEKYTGERLLDGTGDAAVKLYYDNAVKLATTSTGVDITGAFTATTTGTVPTIYGGSGASQTFTLQSTSGNSNHSKVLIGNAVGADNGGISFYSAGTSVATERMRISGTNGDISFYEDTGTTAKFFWDASAEMLTTSGLTVDGTATITTTGNETQLTLTSTDADAITGPNMAFFRNSSSATAGDQTGSIFFIGKDDAGNDTTYGGITTHIVDASNTTEDGRLTISSMKAGTSTETLHVSSGNVGIGVTPSERLDVQTTAGRFQVKALGGSSVELESDSAVKLKAAANDVILDGASNIIFDIADDEKMRIDSSGRLLVGNTDGSYASANADNIVIGDRTSSAESGLTFGSTVASSLRFADAGAVGQGIIQYVHDDTVNTDYMNFYTAGTERMRIDSSGNVGIGRSPTAVGSYKMLELDGLSGGYIRNYVNGTFTGYWYTGLGASGFGTATSTPLTFDTSNSERMRIDSSGNIGIGTTTNPSGTSGSAPRGQWLAGTSGAFVSATYQTAAAEFNRLNNDGSVVNIKQNGTTEGTISVSGTTVSYNGGHLARWSQTADNTRIDGLLKGTVMTNLDQMAIWGDEDNEQLNCMAVSSIEGDPNVAGIFVNWDDDDENYTADMNIAMTGDMIIRIAQGTTVQRGDLLMSAGDGTAKPQGDDIIRSKTIAKVTSTHVTCTYDDGSYCVPCVLMAC